MIATILMLTTLIGIFLAGAFTMPVVDKATMQQNFLNRLVDGYERDGEYSDEVANLYCRIMKG